MDQMQLQLVEALVTTRFNHTKGKLEVKSDNFTIACGDMYIGGTNVSISSSNGEMEISASGFILSGSGDVDSLERYQVQQFLVVLLVSVVTKQVRMVLVEENSM